MAIRVLFLCTGNSARSQMAEGLLRHHGGARFEVQSAGTSPRPKIHPVAIRTMAEHDIDISRQMPKDFKPFVGQPFDYVITLCDDARELCPAIPGSETIHWSFADPASVVGERAQLLAFHEVYRGLKRRIELFMTVAEKAHPAAG